MNKIITAEELKRRVKLAYGVNIHLTDRDYFVPSSKWVMGEFRKYYDALPPEVKIDEYRTNHDCNRKAIQVYHFAGVCIAQMEEDISPQAIACGYIEYRTDDKLLTSGETRAGGLHAINLWCVDDYELRAFEPQEFEWVKLSKAEILSAERRDRSLF